jgi:hypothetical protein
MANSPTAFALLGGGYFDPYADPVDHTVITIESLAVGLRHTNRFRCQTRRPISVEEHLLRQRRFARVIAPPEMLGGELDVWALIDDAHEAFTPWGDAPTPCKTDWMRKIEANIDVAIAKALELGSCPDPIKQVVKQADRHAAYVEALLWGQANALEWAPKLPGRATSVTVLEKLLHVAEPDFLDWESQLRKALNHMRAQASATRDMSGRVAFPATGDKVRQG